MARLPSPGSDDGDWGDILNTYLLVAHNTDGTLRGTITEPLTIDVQTAAQVPLTLEAAASQSADLLDIVDSNNAPLLWITANGAATLTETLSITLGANAIGLKITANSGQTQDLLQVFDHSGHDVFELDAIGQLTVRPNGSTTLHVIPGGIGFFGSTPAIQQPAPSTLTDVINVLTAYGLVQQSLMFG